MICSLSSLHTGTCTSPGVILRLLHLFVRQRCFTYSITSPSQLNHQLTTCNEDLPFPGNAAGYSRTTSVWPKLDQTHPKIYKTKGSHDPQSLSSSLSVHLPCAGSQPSLHIHHLHPSKLKTTPGSRQSMASLKVPLISLPKRLLAFTPGIMSRCSKGTWTTASDSESRLQGKA